MVVAMFAATMSSMDTGLNRNAAVFINDVYPAFCRLLRQEPAGGTRLRWIAQGWTLLLGIAIIWVAVYFSRIEGVGVFRLMQEMGAIFGSVIGVPMLLGLFVRRTPPWSALAAILIAAVPSALGFFSGRETFAHISWMAEPWKMHSKVFLNSSVGAAVFFGTMFFYRGTKPAYKEQVKEFFRCMNTPVDFEKEVGGAVDLSQLKILGGFALVIGILLSGLLFVPNDWGLGGRGGILLVTGTITVIGFLLYLSGRRSERKLRAALSTGRLGENE
jgi:hypothetical protein